MDNNSERRVEKKAPRGRFEALPPRSNAAACGRREECQRREIDRLRGFFVRTSTAADVRSVRDEKYIAFADASQLFCEAATRPLAAAIWSVSGGKWIAFADNITRTLRLRQLSAATRPPAAAMRSVSDENGRFSAERRGRGSAPGFGREHNGNPALGPSPLPCMNRKISVLYRGER